MEWKRLHAHLKCGYQLSSSIMSDKHFLNSIFFKLGLWSQDVHTMQWHVTTQPNFVTKLKPAQWEKLPSHTKPKPIKKPIVSPIPDLVTKTTVAPILSTMLTTSLLPINMSKPSEV